MLLFFIILSLYNLKYLKLLFLWSGSFFYSLNIYFIILINFIKYDVFSRYIEIYFVIING